MKSISWPLITIISKKLYAKKTKKSYLNCLEKIAKKLQNIHIWPFSEHSDLAIWHSLWFIQIHFLTDHQYPHWEASCQNGEKLSNSFWEIAPNWKMSQIWHLSFKNDFCDDSTNPHRHHHIVSHTNWMVTIIEPTRVIRQCQFLLMCFNNRKYYIRIFNNEQLIFIWLRSWQQLLLVPLMSAVSYCQLLHYL